MKSWHVFVLIIILAIIPSFAIAGDVTPVSSSFVLGNPYYEGGATHYSNLSHDGNTASYALADSVGANLVLRYGQKYTFTGCSVYAVTAQTYNYGWCNSTGSSCGSANASWQKTATAGSGWNTFSFPESITTDNISMYQTSGYWLRVQEVVCSGVPLATATPIADFSYTIEDRTVTYQDLSEIAITNRTWNFGDGNISINTTNPSHTFDHDGIFSTQLDVTNASGTNITSKTFIIGEASQTWHLNVDVKDTQGFFVNNINVSLYNSSGTCSAFSASGATGFIHTGAGCSVGIQPNNTYTVSATKADTTNSTSVNFTADYQKVTLIFPNYTSAGNDTYLDLDVRDATTKYRLQTCDVGLYNNATSEWRNASGSSCITGWRNVSFGDYLVAASSNGYIPGYKTVSFIQDHQLVTLELENTWQINGSPMSWTWNIRDARTGALIPYSTVDIYDQKVGIWTNNTLPEGSITLKNLGNNVYNLYPLQIGSNYRFVLTAEGYQSYSGLVQYYENNQTQDMPLLPPGGSWNETPVWGNGTELGASGLPVLLTPTPVSPITTIVGNLSPESEVSVYPTLIVIPTMNQTFPVGLSDSYNATYIRSRLEVTLPQSTIFLSLSDGVIGGFAYIVYTFISLIAYPLLIIQQIYYYSYGLVIGLFNGYSPMFLLVVYTMNQTIEAIPMKVINVITYALALELLFQIWNLQYKMRRLKA